MKTTLSTLIAALMLALCAPGAHADTPAADAGPAASAAVDDVEQTVSTTAEQIDRLGEDLDRAAAGLSPDDPEAAADPNLKALLEYRLGVETVKHGPAAADGPVAIIVPIAFFLLIASLVFLPLFMRNRRRAIEAGVQARAIEAGMQYIPELPQRPLKRHDDRRTGALLAGLGVALAVPCAVVGQPQIAVFGLAPVLLGAVYFLVGSLLRAPSAE